MNVAVCVSFANCLEKISRKIKKIICKKRMDDFLEQYHLVDSKPIKKTDIRYNTYEGTNLYIIDELVKKEIIRTTDVVQDIGCGSGIFLIYLHTCGINNLHGVEMDEMLFELCLHNIKQYCNGGNAVFDFKITKGNAINLPVEDEITCFYLFNPFFDKETYSSWLDNVEASIKRKKRSITIILLYPTVASMGAMRERYWLFEDCRIVCQLQNCYQCMNCAVYRSV